jgi:hypothetical protein
MQEDTAKETIEIPRGEYDILKEIYRTVKRQHLLFRIEEAEKNHRAGKTKKVAPSRFIENI